MASALHLLVRTVHVLGMAVLLGGSTVVWYALRTDRPVPLATFEWLFWATLGAMFVTGVGNLGALGPPGPTTRWGTTLTWKLLVVLVFVLGSGVRTLAVVRRPAESTDQPAFRRLYGATTATLLLLVGLALVAGGTALLGAIAPELVASLLTVGAVAGGVVGLLAGLLTRLCYRAAGLVVGAAVASGTDA